MKQCAISLQQLSLCYIQCICKVVGTICLLFYHSLLIVYLIPCELRQALSVFMKSNLLEPCNDIVCITDWWATSTTRTVWCSMCCQQRRTLWRYHACWAVDVWPSSITSNMHATQPTLVTLERWQLQCIATWRPPDVTSVVILCFDYDAHNAPE